MFSSRYSDSLKSIRVFTRALLLALPLTLAGPPSAWADPLRNFFTAIARDDGRAVETGLMRGVSANTRDPKHGPAIVYAAQQGSLEALEALLLSPSIDIDVRNEQGETALMHAALRGDLDSVTLLVERGAEVNQPGWTALHYAASGGHLEVVQYLIDHHAYIDALSPNGTTPLMMAARQQWPTVARHLVEQGADPTLANQSGLTAADYFENYDSSDHARWMRERADEFRKRHGGNAAPASGPAKRD